MKKLLLVIMTLFLMGCAKTQEPDIKTLMQENEYIIVDVRTESEYEELHIVDSINIPYDEIDENVNLEKDKIIFVYCKSGNRSGIAYNILSDLGYTVYDLGAFSSIKLPKE